MAGAAHNTDVPRVDLAPASRDLRVGGTDQQVAHPARHKPIAFRRHRADDDAVAYAARQRHRSRRRGERAGVDVVPVVGEQVPVPEVTHPRRAGRDHLGQPSGLRESGKDWGEPGDATDDGGPLVRSSDGDRDPDQTRPLAVGRGLGEGAVQDQPAHRVADEDQPAHGDRPSRDERVEQVIEVLAVVRHPQPGVVAHPHRRPRALGPQSTRVALARMPPVAFGADVPPVVGLDEPVDEDHNEPGRVRVCRV